MIDSLVIGAGPAGLATTAMLRQRGVRTRLVDRDATIGGAYARMDPELVLISPPRIIALPGGALPGRGYVTAGEYHAYLRTYADTHELAPEHGAVEAIRLVDRGYHVELASGEMIEARSVVVATGMFNFPVQPALAGRPTVPVIHAAAWRTARTRPGLRVLVVGGATSAVDIAETCARRGCVVALTARRISMMPAAILGIDLAYLLFPVLARVRPRSLCDRTYSSPATDRGFAKLRRAGAIEVWPELIALDGAIARFASGASIEVDVVVLATGYRHAVPFAPQGLALTGMGTARCRRNQSVSHPRLFFVGAPCARSAASQYLYGIARDAVATAEAIDARA